jgi:hypothetical protein
MESKAYKPPVRELASRIYAELVVRSVAVSDDGLQMSTSAENLARLSFRLAEAFQGVEDELNSANLPKNAGFRIEASDIAEWSK